MTRNRVVRAKIGPPQIFTKVCSKVRSQWDLKFKKNCIKIGQTVPELWQFKDPENRPLFRWDIRQWQDMHKMSCIEGHKLSNLWKIVVICFLNNVTIYFKAEKLKKTQRLSIRKFYARILECEKKLGLSLWKVLSFANLKNSFRFTGPWNTFIITILVSYLFFLLNFLYILQK